MDINKIKRDFPILQRRINGHPLVYLDSAATSQKPRQVIKAIVDYYENHNANIHRGLHTLSEEATAMVEAVRAKVAKFINAPSAQEIIFVRNATEAINLVAYAWGRLNLNQGDEIVTTIMEHHSNFVPWQQLAIENGGILKVVDIHNNGTLQIPNPKHQIQNKSQAPNPKFKTIINSKTKLIALAHVSNMLGTINPVEKIVKMVKKVNPECLVLIDGAQAVPHLKVDVRDLGADFYAFSGHKMLGPTGVGVLWARQEILKAMAPFMFGGGQIAEVSLTKSTWAELPVKFEAGTPDMAGIIGLGAAIDYLNAIGMDKVSKHSQQLTAYSLQQLRKIEGLTIYGPQKERERVGVISFNLAGIHPHDAAQILNDEFGIAVRSGHHCTMPLHQRLGIPASVRASFYIYNSIDEVDKLIEGVKRVREKFR